MIKYMFLTIKKNVWYYNNSCFFNIFYFLNFIFDINQNNSKILKKKNLKKQCFVVKIKKHIRVALV
jgi:hypothetical protein